MDEDAEAALYLAMFGEPIFVGSFAAARKMAGTLEPAGRPYARIETSDRTYDAAQLAVMLREEEGGK